MTTDELTPRTLADQRIRKIDDIHDMLTRALSDLDDEINNLHSKYPSVPEVMECEVAGVKWFTDGWRAIRDCWPCEYTKRNNSPDLGRLMPEWQAVTELVSVVEYAESSSQGTVARLSSGAWLNWHLAEELVVGRGYTLHHDGKHMVVLRDREGFTAAAVATLTVSEPHLTNRRPA